MLWLASSAKNPETSVHAIWQGSVRVIMNQNAGKVLENVAKVKKTTANVS